MKCDSQASLLSCTFTSPWLGHEPKVKNATFVFLFILLYMSFPPFFVQVWEKEKKVSSRSKHVTLDVKQNQSKSNIYFLITI